MSIIASFGRLLIPLVIVVVAMAGLYYLFTAFQPKQGENTQGSQQSSTTSQPVPSDQDTRSPEPQPALSAKWAEWYDNLGAMTRRADLIVFAVVTATEPDDKLSGSVPHTQVHLKVERALKGQPQATITVIQTGGTHNNKTFFLSDDPPYVPGDRYLLFLEKGSTKFRGILDIAAKFPDYARYLDKYIVLNPQGRFLIRNGQAVPQLKDDKVAREVANMNEQQIINTLNQLR